MCLEDELVIAEKLYHKEYQTAIRLSYPKEYIFIACKWLHDDWASETAMKYFLLQWEQYVKDAVDIETVKDGNELAWIVFDFKKYGHRNLNRKSFLQN